MNLDKCDIVQYYAVIENQTERGPADPVLFDSIIDAVEYTMDKVHTKDDTGIIDVYRYADTFHEKYCTFHWKKQSIVSKYAPTRWFQFIRNTSDMVGKTVPIGSRISNHGILNAFSIAIIDV